MSYPGPPNPNDQDPRYGGQQAPQPGYPYPDQQGQQPLFPEQYQQPQPAYVPQPNYGAYGQPRPIVPTPKPRPEGQSRGGIVGLVLFGLAVLLYLTMIAIVAIKSGEFDPDSSAASPTEMIVGFIALASMGLNLIGLVASLIGFADRERSKVVCWIGVVLNLLPCLGCGGLIMIGLAAGAAGG